MELTARTVEDKKFATAMRGYSKEEVDAFMATIGAHISTLEQQLGIAQVKAHKAQEKLDLLEDDLATKHAETEAARATIIDEARREAASISATASSMNDSEEAAAAAKTASAIIAEAETKAALRLADLDTMKTAAIEKSSEITKAAEDAAELREAEADRVLDAARRQARAMHAETEVTRSEIEDQLAQLRSILVAAQAGDSSDLQEANVILRNGNEIVIDLSERAKRPDTATTS
ncbi:MAG: DivIVA domain-containing protein [Acidimicrobiia bacterium]